MFNFIFAVLRNGIAFLIWAMLFYGIARADAAQEYVVKSALALNFARFTEWPATTSATVNLCVLGDQLMQQAFLSVDKKTVGNRTLSVIKLSEGNDLNSCQLLYISSQHSNTIKQLRNETVTRHILTIGEDGDFLENGGMINLETVENKINIQVNLGLVQQAKLQISARVLKLVNIVSF